MLMKKVYTNCLVFDTICDMGLEGYGEYNNIKLLDGSQAAANQLLHRFLKTQTNIRQGASTKVYQDTTTFPVALRTRKQWPNSGAASTATLPWSQGLSAFR